jgi:hypothetical protein
MNISLVLELNTSTCGIWHTIWHMNDCHHRRSEAYGDLLDELVDDYITGLNSLLKELKAVASITCAQPSSFKAFMCAW